jgi:dihydroorotate dehydrogenase
MYSLARKLLFLLDPETAHDFSLKMLTAADRLGILSLLTPRRADEAVSVMGLKFPNRIGLAAGLDKNGDYYNTLGKLGFGFVEIGTVTPKPQLGNSRPRLYRLPKHDAIINRMGFNNKGVDYLVERVRQRRFSGVLGINIGKNKQTAEEQALDDYCVAMAAVYPYADYITVNISSPNTPGLRQLQFGDNLQRLLSGLKHKQQKLHTCHKRYVPIAVKIAPDLTDKEIRQIAGCLVDNNIDGVIATNTTLNRDAVARDILAVEQGGLSGAPLQPLSNHVIRQLRHEIGSQLPIIGVGGICRGIDAVEKLNAGADLVQLYTGLIYRGTGLISEVGKALQSRT